MPRLGIKPNVVVMNAAKIRTSKAGQSYTGSATVSEVGSDHHLRLTVVSTTAVGTVTALRTANCLAENLGARITLLVTQVIPFQFPLDRPPVSIDFIQRQQAALVFEAGILEQEVKIQILLCRDKELGLQRHLRPRSLVILGGKRNWWSWEERNLDRSLRRSGHHVIFVDVAASRTSKSLLRSCWQFVSCGFQEKQGLRGDGKMNLWARADSGCRYTVHSFTKNLDARGIAR
jgi:hypothetical protein